MKPQILAQKVQDKYIGRLAVSVWSGYRVQNLRYFAQKVQDKYRQAGSQCMEWVLGTKHQILCSESSGQVYRQAGSQCMEWVPGTKPQILAQKVQDKYIGGLAVSVWSGYRVQNLRYLLRKFRTSI